VIGFGISQGVFFAELRGSFSGHFFEDLREVETIMESGCVGNLLNAHVGLFQKMDRFLNLKTEDMVSRARMKMQLKNAVEAGDAQAGDFSEIVAIQFRGEIPLNKLKGLQQRSWQGGPPRQFVAGQDGMDQCHSQKEVFLGGRERGRLDS